MFSLKTNAGIECLTLPGFFGYNSEVFPLQINSKYVDPSCKTGLDFLNCFGKEAHLVKCTRLNKTFGVTSKRGNPCFIAEYLHFLVYLLNSDVT